MAYVTEAVINILFLAVWGYFIFGYLMILLLVIFVVLQALSIYATRSQLKYEEKWLHYKDERLKYLQSIIKNISYIKLSTLENYFHHKVTNIRAKEMSQWLIMNSLRCLVSLLNYNSVYWAFFGVLAVNFYQGGDLKFEFISPLITIIGFVFATTGYIPYAMNVFIDCQVSGTRLTKFLNTNEISPLKVDTSNSFEANELILSGGNFTWSQKFKDEVNKLMGQPTGLESFTSGMDSKLLMINDASVSLIDEGQRKDSIRQDRKVPDFLVEGLRLELLPGKVNIITGKIGSGKTSILDALFGEMLSYIDNAKLKMSA